MMATVTAAVVHKRRLAVADAGRRSAPGQRRRRRCRTAGGWASVRVGRRCCCDGWCSRVVTPSPRPVSAVRCGQTASGAATIKNYTIFFHIILSKASKWFVFSASLVMRRAFFFYLSIYSKNNLV